MDWTIRILAIIVPIFMTIIFALIGIAWKATLGRVTDKIESVQFELSEHKDACDKVNKSVLASRVDDMRAEIKGLRNFSHWVVASLHALALEMKVRLPERPDVIVEQQKEKS